MTGIVLFSHGSLLCGAGGALEAHAERLRREHGFPLVKVGYLNYSEPLFEEAAGRLIHAGATQIVVVPFFLARGYFVTHSLPKCVEPVRQAHPDIEFLIAPPLGADERIAEAVLVSAGAAKACEYWRDGLLAAGAACRSNTECPVYGKYACAATTPERLTLRPPSRGGKGAPTISGSFPESSATITTPHPPEDGGERRSLGEGLLIMVHGSPKAEANDEMYQVVEMAKARNVYAIVEVGFLECNEPAIPEAIESCIAQGAERIVAVPYFLHTGAHVAEDLPDLLQEAREKHAGVEFLLGEHIGCSDKLTDLLAERARGALKV